MILTSADRAKDFDRPCPSDKGGCRLLKYDLLRLADYAGGESR
jgi:hypothetical protein